MNADKIMIEQDKVSSLGIGINHEFPGTISLPDITRSGEKDKTYCAEGAED